MNRDHYGSAVNYYRLYLILNLLCGDRHLYLELRVGLELPDPLGIMGPL